MNKYLPLALVLLVAAVTTAGLYGCRGGQSARKTYIIFGGTPIACAHHSRAACGVSLSDCSMPYEFECLQNVITPKESQ